MADPHTTLADLVADVEACLRADDDALAVVAELARGFVPWEELLAAFEAKHGHITRYQATLAQSTRPT